MTAERGKLKKMMLIPMIERNLEPKWKENQKKTKKRAQRMNIISMYRRISISSKNVKKENIWALNPISSTELAYAYSFLYSKMNSFKIKFCSYELWVVFW